MLVPTVVLMNSVGSRTQSLLANEHNSENPASNTKEVEAASKVLLFPSKTAPSRVTKRLSPHLIVQVVVIGPPRIQDTLVTWNMLSSSKLSRAMKEATRIKKLFLSGKCNGRMIVATRVCTLAKLTLDSLPMEVDPCSTTMVP
jgi:hypothetical protein